MHIVCMVIRTSSRERCNNGKERLCSSIALPKILHTTTHFPFYPLLRFQSETTHLYDDDDGYVLTIHLLLGSTNIVMMIMMVYNIVSRVHVHNFRTV